MQSLSQVRLSCWLFFGLLGGLEACLQHMWLRLWLWQNGNLPRHLVPFLEDACARHLLKRVGGRYQFVHALLQDFFAKQ